MNQAATFSLLTRKTCLVVSLVFFSLVAQASPLLMCTSDWPPFTTASSNKGVFTLVVNAVVNEMGMTPQYSFYPWHRGEKMLALGKIFASFPYRVTPDRESNHFFSDPILPNETRLFYFKPHLSYLPDYASLSDLKPYLIGGVLGYSYVTEFKNAKLDAQYVVSDRMNIKLLKLGRIDISPINTLVGWKLIHEEFPQLADKFAMADKPLYTTSMHLMVSKKYPNAASLLIRFNDALRRIKSNGVFDKVVQGGLNGDGPPVHIVQYKIQSDE